MSWATYCAGTRDEEGVRERENMAGGTRMTGSDCRENWANEKQK